MVYAHPPLLRGKADDVGTNGIDEVSNGVVSVVQLGRSGREEDK